MIQYVTDPILIIAYDVISNYRRGGIMKLLSSVSLIAILVLTVFSCSDKITNDDDNQPIIPYDTLVFNDPDDAELTPDFESMTFYLYDSTIDLTVELWEPHDSTNYPADYMLNVYLYGTNREVIHFQLHDFNIGRDNDSNGHFEELLAEGVITWSDSITACIEFDKSIMTDFETKSVWMYSMASQDRMPENGRFYIADSL